MLASNPPPHLAHYCSFPRRRPTWPNPPLRHRHRLPYPCLLSCQLITFSLSTDDRFCGMLIGYDVEALRSTLLHLCIPSGQGGFSTVRHLTGFYRAADASHGAT